jgi:hypothetical protein
VFKVLDRDLDAASIPFDKVQDAINLALHYNQAKDVPYYIEDANGDFIYLIYGGVVWAPTRKG